MTVRIRRGVRAPETYTARGDYDFAKSGGAIGTVNLMGRALIPAGATIVGGWVEVLTAPTSGGAATIAIRVEAAGDVVPAQTLATWTLGRKAIVPAEQETSAVLAASKALRTTAKRDIYLDIAAAALTAGKISVLLHFFEPLR